MNLVDGLSVNSTFTISREASLWWSGVDDKNSD